MELKSISGKVVGEVWRIYESDHLFIYFRLRGETRWFRVGYQGIAMAERANCLMEMLRLAGEDGSGIEVALEYEDGVEKGAVAFYPVCYIQVRAQLPTAEGSHEAGASTG